MKTWFIGFVLSFSGCLLRPAFGAFVPCDVNVTTHTTSSSAGWNPIPRVNSGDVLYNLIVTSQTGAATAEIGLYDSWASTFTTTPRVYSTFISTISAMQRDEYIFNVRLSSGLSYRIVGTNPGIYIGICDIEQSRNPVGSWE